MHASIIRRRVWTTSLGFCTDILFFPLYSPSPPQISCPTPQNFMATLQLFFLLELIFILLILICFI